jgi:hypothetical protein
MYPAAHNFFTILDNVHYLRYTLSLGGWLSSCLQVIVIRLMDFSLVIEQQRQYRYYIASRQDSVIYFNIMAMAWTEPRTF